MTSLWHSVSGWPSINPARRSKVSHHWQAIWHTSYTTKLDKDVAQLQKIMKALNNMSIDNDECFHASGMNNESVFRNLGHNPKSRLLKRFHMILDGIEHTPKPRVLSKPDISKIEKNMRLLESIREITNIVSIRERLEALMTTNKI